MTAGTSLLKMAMAVLLAALLAACASGGARGPNILQTATPDRITSSDEPEHTRRARVRLELASAYFARGQVVIALDQVKQAIAADPMIAPAFNLRGLIYSNLGDNQLAEESFQRALALDPADADTMHNYGWHLCQQSRHAEAEALFKRALEVPRYDATAKTFLARGVCHARAGRLDLAEAILERAYDLDSGSPLIAVNLAEVLYQRGSFERARQLMRRVNGRLESSSAQTLWLAAKIENKLGNAQAARAMGEQLAARFPESPEAGAYERRRFDE
ncbi:type IV pilus biogenesis/stability protein PilW [Piscinibacter sakaiensis]|uniref:type IV pilus biogenesis/stability protein PilW n=1 Tax=Piscinibacter sakaiensis TaxID=1547922 RepID=UPI003AAD04F4